MLIIFVFNHTFFLYFDKFFSGIIYNTIKIRNFAFEKIVIIKLNIIKHYKFNSITIFLIHKKII